MRIAATIATAALYILYATSVVSCQPHSACPGTPAANTEQQDHEFYATRRECK